MFTLLFKGTGTTLLRDDPDTMRDIYRILKNLHGTESDEVTRLHVSGALDVLSGVMKDSLFTPTTKMEKKIEILGYSV